MATDYSSIGPTRPVLRYPGGKFLLAPWITSFFPPHQTYVEPLCGAASCLLQKPRSYAEVLNDLDGEIVNLFRLLRDPTLATELERQLRLTPYARQEYEDAYLPSNAPLEQARRLLIRSWQGLHGEGTLGRKTGWRSNVNRRGTLPAHDWGRFPGCIGRFTERLQGVIIESRDALDILLQYDSPQTLFYIDPPYDTDVCPNFNGYRHSVDAPALRRALNRAQGMAIVSGYRSPVYDTLYADWMRVDRATNAGTGQAHTRKRTESLWLSPACTQAMSQLSLFQEAPHAHS